MTISIIWSTVEGGAAITDTVDHGDSRNGDETTPQTLYVRATGNTNPLVGVGFYIREKSDPYTGGATPNGDLMELLGWGNDDTVDGFGGVQVNYNATGSFPEASWPTYDNKSPTGGVVFRTGVGDSETNAIPLSTLTGANVAEEIQPSETDIHIQIRVQVPADENIIGNRQFEIVLVYTYV